MRKRLFVVLLVVSLILLSSFNAFGTSLKIFGDDPNGFEKMMNLVIRAIGKTPDDIRMMTGRNLIVQTDDNGHRYIEVYDSKDSISTGTIEFNYRFYFKDNKVISAVVTMIIDSSFDVSRMVGDMVINDKAVLARIANGVDRERDIFYFFTKVGEIQVTIDTNAFNIGSQSAVSMLKAMGGSPGYVSVYIISFEKTSY